MTRRLRGWRSARAWDAAQSGVRQGPDDDVMPVASAAWSSNATPAAAARRAPFFGRLPAQASTRLSFVLAAIIVYLWVIHSYKLAIGTVAIGAALGAVLLRPDRIRIPAPLIFLAAFGLWSAVGLSISSNSASASFDQLLVFAKVWAVVFVIFNGVQSARELRILVIAWLGLFALYPLRGAFYNQFICHCTPGGRVAWNFVFENPNDLAALTFLPLGLAAVVVLLERAKLWRYMALFGIVCLGLLIALTQSRGALIALIVTGLLTIASRRQPRDVLVIGAAALVVWIIAPKAVWTRLSGLMNASVEQGMVGVDEERSAESRWLIWKVATAVIKTAPATGVGLGTYPEHHAVTAPTISPIVQIQGKLSAHSTYLTVTAETGFIGLFLYLSFCLSTFAYVRRVRKSLRNTRPREHQALLILQLSLVALLIAALFGSFGVFVYAYLHFGAVLVVAEILRREPWPLPASSPAPVEELFVGAPRVSARRSF